MLHRRLASLIIVSVALAATLTTGCSGARAVEASTVESLETPEPATSWLDSLSSRMGSAARRCDLEAGDAMDPAFDQPGVELEDIDTGAAITACGAAVAAHPGDVVRRYELARAQMVGGDLVEALKNLNVAAEGGSCAAQYFLGIGAQEGWAAGTTPDLDAARLRFQAAVECGYPPALDALEAITFDPSVFVRPDLMGWLADGGDDAIIQLNRMRPFTASYLQGVFAMLGEHWIPGGETCATTPLYTPGPVNRALDAAERGDAPSALHRVIIDALFGILMKLDPVGHTIERIREIYREQGRTDGLRMVVGLTCDSAITQQIAQSITRFADTPRPITDVVAALAKDPSVRRLVQDSALSLKEHRNLFDQLLMNTQ